MVSFSCFTDTPSFAAYCRTSTVLMDLRHREDQCPLPIGKLLETEAQPISATVSALLAIDHHDG